MAYYVVKKGRKTGIFDNYDKVEPLVKGYKGAIHKKFDNEEEAIAFLNKPETEEMLDANGVERLVADLKDDEAIIVTDGSYDSDKGIYSYGYILISNKEGEVEFSGTGNESKYSGSWNIAGEVVAVLDGLKTCKEKGYKKVKIIHDLIHLSRWVNGEYKTTSDIAKEYVKEIENYKNDLKILFYKVKGHSGVKYNERADELAGKAIKGE
ncbi:ribonuclease H1 domain-containing protein [Staphylococcus simulans]|uniref:ribonuclease H1 domain-containing protein n=1 Tax=Staphylococcus simulans TaxID=1286 RepID=UPI000D1F681C|nr:ribonuclease H family protein [Staphylococcus simulans]MDY5059570.1 ribonuclease H family protein [Staphylococcus simulans]PTJ14332.1 hypothetical protein BU038_10530 [Staphylococcus simulans]